jgi:hypothetical protein
MTEKKTDPPVASETPPKPEWDGSLSSSEPVVGPDGHVHLSADDIKARDRG